MNSALNLEQNDVLNIDIDILYIFGGKKWSIWAEFGKKWSDARK